MTILTVTATPTADAIAVIDVMADEYRSHSKSAATLAAYKSDWRLFSAWCDAHRVAPLPASPRTLAAYVADVASSGRKVSTIARRLAAISRRHQSAGFENPTRADTVRETMQGIRRAHGVAPHRMTAVTTDDVRDLLAATGPGLRGQRDRAIILLGFAGAFRRSELVALDVADVVTCAEGLRVTIRSSKTDQQGAGRVVGILHGRGATCPVRAVQEWIAAAGLVDGALFRSIDMIRDTMGGRLCARNVARIVSSCARRAGLAGTFGGHSLRAGHATVAASNGTSERAIMEQTGHRSVTMVRRYIRRGQLFADNSSGRLGL